MVPVRPGAEPDAAVAGVRGEPLHGGRRLPAARGTRRDGPAPGRRARKGSSGALRSSVPVQVVSGTFAWNLAAPPAPRRARRRGGPAQPAAVEERVMEIWTTPHGFLKAAAANKATSTPSEGGSEVTFTMDGKYKYVGRINAQNEVERVQTLIDNTVLGDTPVEIVYSGYRDFEGMRFPSRIVRTQGGHPVLELTIEKAAANPSVAAEVPEQVRGFTPPAVTVVMEPLAPGVSLRQGGQSPQHRHRSARSHRRRRSAAGRGALAGGHREGQGDDSRTSPFATSSTLTCISTTRAASAPMSPRAPRL